MDASGDEPGGRSVPSVGRVAKTIALTSMAAVAASPAVSAIEAGPQFAAASASVGVTPVVPDTAIDTGATDPVTAAGNTDVLASTKRGAVAAVAASPSEIPAAALAAYQRAAVVINAADSSCRMPWQLLAAIGRVESDHGRYGGSALDADGLAQPAIYGPRLDGSRRTIRVTDTDAGRLDRDKAFDRAVGPMQFIPSTWSLVGVDADGDGVRNPQDVDDAALAAAVYLCSGEGDLSTAVGQRSAVYRYNHSTRYVEVVLALTAAYQRGDFSSPTTGVARTQVTVPATFVDTQHNLGHQTQSAQLLGGHTLVELLGPLHILVVGTPHHPGHAQPVSDTGSLHPGDQPGEHPTVSDEGPTAGPTATAAPPETTATPTPTTSPTTSPTTDPASSSTSDPTPTTDPTSSPTTSPTTSSSTSSDSTASSNPTVSTTSSYDPALLLEVWQLCVDGGVTATDQLAMTSCMAGLMLLDPADQQLVDYVAAQAATTP